MAEATPKTPNRKYSISVTSRPRRFSKAGKPTEDNEQSSKIHREFRSAHKGHRAHPGLTDDKASTGVVWVTEKANDKGYSVDNSEWASLGQGAPEVEDDIAGCFQRPDSIPLSVAGREYGPTVGIKSFRAAVANLYNVLHRQGKESQYSYENVCVVPGGRAGLIRISAILNESYLSYFIPEYPPYTEVLSCFKNVAAIPTPLAEEDNYTIHPAMINEAIARGTSVILTSNPRNPSGTVTKGADLEEIHSICRHRATLIMDEFYAGYNYTSDCDGTLLSSASYVEDVDTDDVIIINGLTKQFRLPGVRCCWVIGPKAFIKALGSAGSYLDGGAAVPFQEAFVKYLEPSLVTKEMSALQKHFKAKRDFVIRRLREIGFTFRTVPEATFYIWLDLSGMPASINDGLNFFEKCLEEKVIVVPGIFFDLNPSKRRDLFDSPCHHHIRISYGPKLHVLKLGMDGIERVVKKARRESILNSEASSAFQEEDSD